jgi:hypothetical protein
VTDPPSRTGFDGPALQRRIEQLAAENRTAVLIDKESLASSQSLQGQAETWAVLSKLYLATQARRLRQVVSLTSVLAAVVVGRWVAGWPQLIDPIAALVTAILLVASSRQTRQMKRRLREESPVIARAMRGG